MKRTITCLLAVTLLAVGACTKETDCCVIPTSEYYVSGKLNNEAIILEASTPSTQNDTTTIPARFGERLFILKLKKANNVLSLGSADIWFTVGLDATVARYKLVNHHQNAFSITTNANDKAEGTFNLVLAATYKNGSYPDTIKFTGGKFRVKVK